MTKPPPRNLDKAPQSSKMTLAETAVTRHKARPEGTSGPSLGGGSRGSCSDLAGRVPLLRREAPVSVPVFRGPFGLTERYGPPTNGHKHLHPQLLAILRRFGWLIHEAVESWG
jgi:hypothetical protein